MWEKFEELLQEAAQECIASLKPEDVDHLRLHLDYSYHHFGYGLSLRNRFSDRFYAAGMRGDDMRDELGYEIMCRMIPILFPEFGNDLQIVRRLSNSAFSDLNANFYLKNGKMIPAVISPDTYLTHLPTIDDLDMNDDWKRKLDEIFDLARKQYRAYEKTALDLLWDMAAFKRNAAALGYSDEEISETIDFSQKMWDEHDCFLPLEMLYVKHPSDASMDAFMSVHANMEWFFNEHYSKAKELPSYIYQNREMIELAVSRSGSMLQYAPDFQDDYEIVLKAVTDSPSAIQYANSKLQGYPDIVRTAAENSKYTLIFEVDCMKKFADDDEIVMLALTANGANICYASERIRDDYKMASYALQHQSDSYPHSAYPSLSERLRGNQELALMELTSPCPSLDGFSEELLDSDEVAEFLVTHKDTQHFLSKMSKRIMKKYRSRVKSRIQEMLDYYINKA